MNILAIETSCDETAIALLSCDGSPHDARFKVRGNAVQSQIDIHRAYGGVFPALAKREHAKNIVPVLVAALEEAEALHETTQAIPDTVIAACKEILVREPGLTDAFLEFIQETERPDIDAIAVTHGPGLEPALWVGVNFARALALAWEKPLIPVNHMEGHLLAGLSKKEGDSILLTDIELPVLALLISGGHTELVSMPDWGSYTLVGQTRDDAVGEAFDKVARMMDLPYPGGPEISRLAERDREDARTNPFSLPRPMIDTDDCDFSFSGLKTSVLYTLKKIEAVTGIQKEQLARAFEDAVGDVLFAKASKALMETGAKTLVLGGGVSANTHIRRTFATRIAEKHPEVSLRLPAPEYTTDNAIMIGITGYFRAQTKAVSGDIRAEGNLALS